jgi:hypothetical protein
MVRRLIMLNAVNLAVLGCMITAVAVGWVAGDKMFRIYFAKDLVFVFFFSAILKAGIKGKHPAVQFAHLSSPAFIWLLLAH